MKQHMSSFDTFYLSYDEPNAEENWAHLQSICPWAQRVHGVKGFDAAHKRCAELSTTDRFITVDGDNQVYPSFFDLEFEIPDHLADCTLSWAGRNIVNGLIYGNGGLKLWTKDFVLGMRTHENASSNEETTDFCWDEKYIQLNGLYSDTIPNGTPFQAFRAGFREGVKMTLDRGRKLRPADIKEIIHPKNMNRLLIWGSIGSDVPYGDFAIYGTRLGVFLSTMTRWDIAKVSDYDWFKSFWVSDVLSRVGEYYDDESFAKEIEPEAFTKDVRYRLDFLQSEIVRLGNEIKQATGIEFAYFEPNQSSFFKTVYEPPKRTVSPLATEIEVDNGTA